MTSSRDHRRARRAAFAAAALVAVHAAAADPPATAPAQSGAAETAPLLRPANADAAAPAMTKEELDRLLSPLGDANPAARHAAATAASQLGGEALGAIEAELEAMRALPDDAFKGPLRAARATRGARGAARHDDLVDALVAAGDAAPADVRAPLAAVCLLRSLARQRTTPALRALIGASSDHAFALRLEATRLLRDVGAAAVPALIEAKNGGPATQEWAQSILESIGKRTPADAVQTDTGAELAEVLIAYGGARDVDALTVVLAFVDSDRTEVREAARQAVAGYGALALGKLREAYANLTGKPAPPDWDAARAARELFAAHDRVRLQDVLALFDDGLAQGRDGKIDDAVANFDRVLARQPLFDRRAEMALVYVQYARSREAADRAAAIDALLKAERLDPGGAGGRAAASELAVLEGEDLEARGVRDPEPFHRALDLDATNARARAAIDRIDGDARARRHRWAAGLAGVAGVSLLVAILILFVRVPARRLKS